MGKELIASWAEEPISLSTRYLESFYIVKFSCAYLVSEYDPLILNTEEHHNVLSSKNCFTV